VEEHEEKPKTKTKMQTTTQGEKEAKYGREKEANREEERENGRKVQEEAKEREDDVLFNNCIHGECRVAHRGGVVRARVGLRKQKKKFAADATSQLRSDCPFDWRPEKKMRELLTSMAWAGGRETRVDYQR
jgi:hypothetical protein